jgi:xanthine dehydrogenase YagT iron-sulfur-binding subunit
MEDADRSRVTRRSFIAGTTVSAIGLNAASTASASAKPARQSPRSAEAAPGAVTLSVNGAEHQLEIEPRVTLLDALRDRIGLTGSKKGCDQGTCGACTVLVNGKRIVSCLSLAIMHQGDEITTIEGLAKGEELHPVQAAFITYDGFQCGYCTPGQICSAVGMLNEGHPLDRDTIRMQMSGNICRCGCYAHIVDAIAEAGAQR